MGRREETAGQGFRSGHDESVLKRGQQHPLKDRSLKPRGVALNLSELLLCEREQPGSISHPIGNWK